MNTEATWYEVNAGAAKITLNRPENRNALSATLVNEVYEHLQKANNDPEVRCIVLAGNGPAFCAGADLKSPPGQSIDGGGKAVPLPDLLTAMIDSPKPVIACVNGAAFGGGIGLVAAADIVFTSREAVFSFSEVRLGVIPAVISVVVIPRIGSHQARRWFLNGERFKGDIAVDIGLAHEAVAPEDLEAVVAKEIQAICQGGPAAVIECKNLLRQVPNWNMADGFKRTSDWSVRMFNSEEGLEGMAAFKEKRAPNWIAAITESGK